MKKKKEKEVIQEKPEPQEIKLKFELGRLVFELGDRQFFLKEEQANFLFGRNVGIRFEQLRADEREDFSDLNTSDFIAKFTIANEFYGSLPGTVKYLKVDDKRLRRWMSDNYSTGLFNKLTIYDGNAEYQESCKKYRAELFGEEKKEEIKPFNPDMKMINKIAHLVMKKYSPRRIAEKLKFDYGPFIGWLTSAEPQRRIQNIISNEISRRESLKNREKDEGPDRENPLPV